MEEAEQWGSPPLGKRAVTSALSTLEQGGHCELGDRGQRTDRQSLPGHVGGESDTSARLAPWKTECSRGQGADARASCAVRQPGGSRASGGRKRGGGQSPENSLARDRGQVQTWLKSPLTSGEKGMLLKRGRRLACGMQAGFGKLSFSLRSKRGKHILRSEEHGCQGLDHECSQEVDGRVAGEGRSPGLEGRWPRGGRMPVHLTSILSRYPHLNNVMIKPTELL